MTNRKLTTEEIKRRTPEENINSAKLPIAVVLDNVRSLNNIGSVFRTCDALAVELIVLCGISGTPPHREIHRTALGAEDSVKWIYFNRVEDALAELKEQGYTLHTIEQTTNSIDLRSFKPNSNAQHAFIFGNEVKGVTEDVLSLTDDTIEIPQFGHKHSFNVAVSAGIVLWDTYSKLTGRSNHEQENFK